jgi:hypothetical protein
MNTADGFFMLRCIGATALLVTLAFGRAQAQEAGSLHGHVHDAATREPLIGANVVVLGTSIGAAADLNGEFTIRNLPAGAYRVQASAVGYAPLVKTDIVVAAGRQNQLDFALEAASIEVGEVVVEADYFTRTADEPVSTQTLSYEEIRRAPGGQEDVVRAVAALPGVAQVSAGRNDLIVRGGAPSENLSVVDDLEVPNINHFGTQGATGGPLSFINLDFVRDVTFSTGGFGARYGDKLSSVMTIALREGRDDRLGGKATISATQFGLNVEGPVSGNGTFFLSARRSYLDFVFRAAGFGFVPEYWDFLGKAVWRLDSRSSLSVLAVGALDNVRFFNDTEDQRYTNARILGNAQNQYASNVSWRRVMGDGFLSVALGRSFVRYDYLQADSLLRPVFTSLADESVTSLRADAVALPARDVELSFGVQGKRLLARGDLASGANPFIPDAAAYSARWDDVAWKGSAYAQLSLRVVPQVTATAGARLEYFSAIDEPLAVAPRGAISVAVSPKTTLTLSGGIYHQAPSLIWVVSNPANTRLRHIRADQAVLGVEHLLRPDLKARLEAYVKRYTGYPASETRPWLVLSNSGAGYGGAEDGFSAFGFDPLRSSGTGTSRGVEFLLQKRFSDLPAYGIASLTYGRMDAAALDGVRRPGSFDQRVLLSLSGGYMIDRRWELGLRFRLGTGAPYTPYLATGQPDVARSNAERLPTFHSLDLRVDRRWDFDAWNLIAYVDVQNVYNRRNIQGYRWDSRTMQPQSSTGSIGIPPTIGLSAEF